MMTEAPETTTDLKELALLAGQPDRMDELLARGLGTLIEAANSDLACVLELRANELAVRAAAGRMAAERVRHHSFKLDDFPNILQVLQARSPRVLGAGGNPYEGLLEEPKTDSCLVVPMVHGGHSIGALTLSCTEHEPYDDHIVDLATICAQVIGLAMTAALEFGKWPTLNEMQSDYIRKVLERTRGKIYGPGGAAEILDIKPSTLQSRMQKLGVERLPSRTHRPG